MHHCRQHIFQPGNQLQEHHYRAPDLNEDDPSSPTNSYNTGYQKGSGFGGQGVQDCCHFRLLGTYALMNWQMRRQ